MNELYNVKRKRLFELTRCKRRLQTLLASNRDPHDTRFDFLSGNEINAIVRAISCVDDSIEQLAHDLERIVS